MNSSIEKIGKRIWIEKTHVKNRPDRTSGEYSVGKSLWSPQRDKADRDIYSQMREIRPGDVVIHLIDNLSISRVSVVESELDQSFKGIPNTDWSNVPSYLISLCDSIEVSPPLLRESFFRIEPYKTTLKKIRSRWSGLFYNSNLDLNQGSYITECPLTLARVFCEIYKQTTSHTLPHLEKIDEPRCFYEAEMDRSFDADSGELPSGEIVITELTGPILAKPFLILTGPSGTGKTRGAVHLAEAVCDEDSRALVAVGADWTDNRHVLGYLNPLQTVDGQPNGIPIYETTPILDLILHANAHPEQAHVLILDEMNLSHVERYFADFLSAMELDEKGNALKLHSADDARTRGGVDVQGRIDFPENLFVIGTVNIDETTYMFSPKVLDRANVIEIHANETALENFLNKIENGGGGQEAKDYGISFLEAARVIRNGDAEDDRVPELPGVVREAVTNHLMGLFRIMKRGRGEYGFRTGKEVMAYLRTAHFLAGPDAAPRTAWAAVGEANGDWVKSLDEQVLQKILPKLHGSRSRLTPLLGALIQYCATANETYALEHFPGEDGSTAKRGLKDACATANPVFGKSYEKLKRMIDVLVEEQFVSFIC